MNDLPSVVGKPWCELLDIASPPQGSFETQFSWLRDSGRYEQRLKQIEGTIVEYFESLELPDRPTIYDYLVLGLRAKDVVATFNWDPFLLLAHQRNRSVTSLPDIRFLHGCVRYATCREHDVLGSTGEVCPVCRRHLVQSSLFFPDAIKDYAKDPRAHRDWVFVTDALKKAFHLTIFGYSGPATDFNARALLLDGWTKTPFRDFSHVEIIDLKDESALRQNWKDFIPFSHDICFGNFWESTIARWPRRTQDYKLLASLYGLPSRDIGPFRTDSLKELQEWHAQIARSENCEA